MLANAPPSKTSSSLSNPDAHPHFHIRSSFPHPMWSCIDTSGKLDYTGKMPYRITPLVNGHIYHVYNRGIEKRNIYTDRREYARFLEIVKYYQQIDPQIKFSQADHQQKENLSEKKLVEIIAYCLMPNHFHFLLQQLADNGISIFIRRLINSYTRYFNTKNDRIGPLLQGPFKAVRMESDQQLIHVTRYIHLNPFVGYLVKDLRNFEWSSYLEYLGLGHNKLCRREKIENLISLKHYERFVLDYADYARQLEKIKHLLLDAGG